MCDALLRVTFKYNDPDQTIDVECAHDVPDKLAALKSQAGVKSVKVYMLTAAHRLTETWVGGE